MNVIAVDDERPALWTLEQAILSAAPQATVTGFIVAQKAVEFAEKNAVDVAFLDIKMASLNGLFLARRLKEIRGETNIIFVTGYSKYTANALEMRVSGYVMKPISSERVADELDNLRHPVKPLSKGIRVQCFGNFEVFVDGEPVTFGRSKAKEALAYLVDRRGAGVNKKEMAAVLLGDEGYTRSMQSYTHIIIAEMIQSLKEVGADGIIIKKHNLFAVDTSKFACDYYSFEKGDVAAVNGYRGEYMTNYSWAEFTAGTLSIR